MRHYDMEIYSKIQGFMSLIKVSEIASIVVSSPKARNGPEFYETGKVLCIPGMRSYLLNDLG